LGKRQDMVDLPIVHHMLFQNRNLLLGARNVMLVYKRVHHMQFFERPKAKVFWQGFRLLMQIHNRV
jgi:hypothetical protein